MLTKFIANNYHTKKAKPLNSFNSIWLSINLYTLSKSKVMKLKALNELLLNNPISKTINNIDYLVIYY